MTTPNHEQIKKMWTIFACGPDSILELRAIWPKGTNLPSPGGPIIKHFRGSNYPSTAELREAFEESALDLNAQGYNIYIVMNPITPSFRGTKAAKDVDIEYRDLLLIDIDRVSDTSSPATIEEIEAARDLAVQVKDFLHGWPEPIMVMSGNGVHLYYVVNAENTKENAELFRLLLQRLSEDLNNDIVGIDTSVYNASRITKVPGTIARKGVESEGRSYRMAEVYE